MQVECSEQFTSSVHLYVIHIFGSFTESLSGKLLHLDVVKLTEVAEPFDQLWRGRPGEL